MVSVTREKVKARFRKNFPLRESYYNAIIYFDTAQDCRHKRTDAIGNWME